MTKKNPVEEEEPPKISSPGFLKHGFIFEQVKNGLFAQGETVDLSAEYTIRENTYQPLKRCPWPLAADAVKYGSLSDLWCEIRAFIHEHLFLPEDALYDVLTAWVMATWTPEIWNTVPYVFFYGPPSTGKTRGLEVLHRLCYRGVLASNISSSALFRLCDIYHPTLFLDETEIYNREMRREVTGLLNSGYRRGQCAWRVHLTADGRGELEPFETFGQKGLAGTRKLAETLTSRCIPIRMLRARRKVRLTIDEKKATDLRCKLLSLRIATLTSGELGELREQFMGRVPNLNIEDGRLRELFTPLLAVSNEGHEAILKYAHREDERRRAEERATEEAEIIRILVNHDLTDEKGMVLTKKIVEKYNEHRADRDKTSSRFLGYMLHQLGFLKVHTRKGNGWKIDQERLQYYAEIYNVSDTFLKPIHRVHSVHTKQGELGSTEKSPTSPNELSQKTVLKPIRDAEPCPLCGQFPVSYEFTDHGQQIRRCKHCIEEMKKQGIKFMTLREISGSEAASS